MLPDMSCHVIGLYIHIKDSVVCLYLIIHIQIKSSDYVMKFKELTFCQCNPGHLGRDYGRVSHCGTTAHS
jgi:hypothetical protein